MNLEQRVKRIEDHLNISLEPDQISGALKPTKYSVIGSTHVIEVDPMSIGIKAIQSSGVDLKLNNAMNASFVGWQPDGKAFPTSMLVSDGKVIHNGQPNGFWSGKYKGKGVPTPTLIIYENGKVVYKVINDITQEKEKVRFAVSGVGVYPKVDTQGFHPYVNFQSVAYNTHRIGIGYRKIDDMIILVYRPLTTAYRLKDTFNNLNCDFGISLDSGGSANLIVDGNKIKTTTRQMYGWITW